MLGRSTTEQIHTIRQLIEKTLEYKRKAYIAFVDFRSAFDTVDRQSLWLILQSAGVPKKIVNLFKELHNKTESAVLVNGQLSSHFQIRNGVRQGCAAAPELFNCVMDHVLNKTLLAHPFASILLEEFWQMSTSLTMLHWYAKISLTSKLPWKR
jgi:sorting nexin-29